LPVITAKLISIPAGFTVNFAISHFHFIVFRAARTAGRKPGVAASIQRRSDLSRKKAQLKQYGRTTGGGFCLENHDDVTYGLVA
jgi:hypothetical protein